MIPSDYSYYSRRAREHRALANAARHGEQRAMHEKLVEAYLSLARLHRPQRNVALHPCVSEADRLQAELEKANVRLTL